MVMRGLDALKRGKTEFRDPRPSGDVSVIGCTTVLVTQKTSYFTDCKSKERGPTDQVGSDCETLTS